VKTWHIVVDVDKCVGCYTCQMACKDEHVGNAWFPYTDEQRKQGQHWIRLEKSERGSYPRVDVSYRAKLCNHCGDAPCAQSAPNAVIRREDGLVLLDPSRAKGNRALVDACPYGNISWNDEIGAAQKCTFCAHLIDEGWKEPRCVQSCPLRALRVVRLEDAKFEALAELKELVPVIPASSRPRVYYKNAHRIDKVFIAGEIARTENGKDACAKNAEVFLIKDGTVVATTTTDPYGDFRFDALDPGSGEYTVTSDLPGFGNISETVLVASDCVDIGTVRAK
jgi:Fe-S-cluster-containing dehydrogenase component